MKAQFVIFISIVAAILGAGAYYVGLRLIQHWPWARHHSGAVWLTLALFILLQVLGPFLYRVLPDHVNRLFMLHWVIYMSLGVFACVFFYMLLAEILVLASRFFFGIPAAVMVDGWSFTVVTSLVAASVVIGALQVAKGPRVYDVEVPIPNLPQGFEGFRIVQISDLHVGPTIGRVYAQRVVDKANALAPDLVALTGDLIDGSVAQLRYGIEPIAGLRGKEGSFLITGNHEYFWNAGEWIEEFRRLGLRVLLNEHAVIRRGGASLVIAGVTDEMAVRLLPEQASDIGKAVAGAPEDAVKILLSHRPSNYKESAKSGFQLQLSGHTHGGQFFPWSLIVAMAFRFGKGLHRYGNLWVYVSRGTGYWGPPLRFGVPAEMTLIRLKRS